MNALSPGQPVRIDVNQNIRNGRVLAILGNEALIEYDMPNTTTSLRIVPNDNPNAWPYRNVSYNSLPNKWVKAVDYQLGIDCMIANPQQTTVNWERISNILERDVLSNTPE